MNAVAGSASRSTLRHQAALVFRRELITRVQSNMYLASLAFSLLIVVAIAALNAFTFAQVPVVGVVGEQPVNATKILDDLRYDSDQTEVDVETFDSVKELEAAVLSGAADVGVVDGEQVLIADSPDPLSAQVQTAWQYARLDTLMASDSVPSDTKTQLAAALTPPSLRTLAPEGDAEGGTAIAIVIVIVMFMSVQVMAGIVTTSVVEEKTGHIVESILASISARSLLIGKLAAALVLGLVQMAVLVIAMLVAIRVFDLADIPSVAPVLVAVALLWFLVGFLFFGALMAAGASLAGTQEDAQTTVLPVIGVALVAYFVAFAVSASPNALWARVISVVPPVSAFTIPARYATGDVTWWEFVIALVINIIVIVGVVRFAERIYTRSIIGGDRKLSWTGALRSEAVR